MNLVLLTAEDCIDEALSRVRLTDGRADHIRNVLKCYVGQTVKIGLINGPFGTGRVTASDSSGVVLEITTDKLPTRPRVTMILAMVRPQIMKRTLQHLATLGVRRILLVGARRVEKAFFSQRLFDGDEYKHHLMLGLEQARDTWLPELIIHRRFKPLVEDVLPKLLGEISARVVAHPGGSMRAMPLIDADSQVALAVGPEGGWTDY